MSVAALVDNPATLAVMGLRELRLERVLSQRELAERAGVSPKTVLDIETGKIRPHPATLRKLATALGVEPTALSEHLRARTG